MINANYDSDITFGKKYCLIPKCKARCCSNAPIPFLFLERMGTYKQDKFTRNVFEIISAPQTNPYCRDAVIPVTRQPLNKYPLKITKINGKKVYTLDVGEILKDEKNYCPFLTKKGHKCNIYESRPKVCRDFGVGSFYCDDQVTLREYLQYYWTVYKRVVNINIQKRKTSINEKLHLEECKKFIKDIFSK